MTKGVGLPGKGIAYKSGGGGGGPVPITKPITFGYKASLTGLTTDNWGNMYLLYNAPSGSTADDTANLRAMTGDVLTKISIGVGASTSGTATVALYSADALLGPWTLVQKWDVVGAPTGTNIIIDTTVNVALTKGKIYSLGVNSPSLQLCQLASTGGLKRWTAAAGVAPSPIADADSAASNWGLIMYGTVNRTTQP